MALESVSFKPVGGGFVIAARYKFVEDGKVSFAEEEKVASTQGKLKKVLKFYLDELKEKGPV